ncbi:YwiC-like family protein [Desulfotomaculum sp. 1211_IL3151]|uniref:YwiC-like family protein n=1 Tax=Desulfotomaculum sp. 1211_IL3151 TaxID=3084055 RepID=UPI002FDA953C
MSIVLPKEHGAWAMLIVPFVVGVVPYGPTWLHLPLFLGWFFLYLSSCPLRMLFRNPQQTNKPVKWLAIYSIIGTTFLMIPLYYHWQLLSLGLLMVPLLGANLYFARVKREREFVNNLSGIAALSLGSVASIYVAVGAWTEEAFWVWLFCVLFFGGSVFFVKTKIRERNNTVFLYYSWLYHGLLVLLPIFLSEFLLALAYLPSFARSTALTKREMSPLQIGQVEILNSLFFTVAIINYLKLA